MKTLVVEIDFDDDIQGAVASVSEVLAKFEISKISWKDKQPAGTWNHRTASTARSALEGI